MIGETVRLRSRTPRTRRPIRKKYKEPTDLFNNIYIVMLFFTLLGFVLVVIFGWL